MDAWKKLDIFGRGLVLFAIAFQMILVSELQTVQRRGDIHYIMGNQSIIVSMVNALSSGASRSEVRDENIEKYLRVYLSSEQEENGLSNQVSIVNTIFIISFLIGSVLILIGRYLEVKDT